MVLDDTDIYRVARAAGFTPNEAVTLTAIALAESGGQTTLESPDGDRVRVGLWQLDPSYFPDVSAEDLRNPAVNARLAYELSGRGLDIGRQLMLEFIEYSKKVGKKRIILECNTRNIPAIKLYRKFGFKEIPLDPNTPYERANIRMELKL